VRKILLVLASTLLIPFQMSVFLNSIFAWLSFGK